MTATTKNDVPTMTPGMAVLSTAIAREVLYGGRYNDVSMADIHRLLLEIEGRTPTDAPQALRDLT